MLKNLLNIGKSCVFPTRSRTAAFPESFDLGSKLVLTIPELYWYDRFTGDGEKKNGQSVTACDSGWIENQKGIVFEKINWVTNRVYHENGLKIWEFFGVSIGFDSFKV